MNVQKIKCQMIDLRLKKNVVHKNRVVVYDPETGVIKKSSIKTTLLLVPNIAQLIFKGLDIFES